MTGCCFDMAVKAASASSLLVASSSSTDFRCLQQLRIGASSSAAPPGVDLNTLQSAIAKKDSSAVKEALDQLVKLVGPRNGVSHQSPSQTSLMELTTLGIENAETLAVPSVRNDVALLFTVVGTTGFLSLLAGQLPGCLFAGPSYSGMFSRCWEEHVNLIDERLEKLIYSGQLDAKELDRLAVVAMAGFAAEGRKYDKVIGQSADLFTLQIYQQKQAAAQQRSAAKSY